MPDPINAASIPCELEPQFEAAQQKMAVPATRVYFRHYASDTQAEALRQHLRKHAGVAYTIGRQRGWKVVEVTREADLLSPRKTFPRVIDGWRELSWWNW